MVAAARAEGALTLVWSPSSLNGAERMPGCYLVAESRKAAEIDRLRAGGAKIVPVNAEFFLGHDEQELNRTLLEVQRILRQE